MFKLLFLLFVVMPIIEIAVLMQVGEIIGAWQTVAIVIVTAWFGAKHVRQQGIATLQSVQHKMAEGQMPSNEITAGLLILVAGVLLVTPGFVTDAFGLLLLVPVFRNQLIILVQQQLTARQNNHVHFSFHQQHQNQQQPSEADVSPFESNKQVKPSRQGQTLDGEFERKD